jgi:hypothetical protein
MSCWVWHALCIRSVACLRHWASGSDHGYRSRGSRIVETVYPYFSRWRCDFSAAAILILYVWQTWSSVSFRMLLIIALVILFADFGCAIFVFGRCKLVFRPNVIVAMCWGLKHRWDWRWAVFLHWCIALLIFTSLCSARVHGRETYCRCLSAVCALILTDQCGSIKPSIIVVMCLSSSCFPTAITQDTRPRPFSNALLSCFINATVQAFLWISENKEGFTRNFPNNGFW